MFFFFSKIQIRIPTVHLLLFFVSYNLWQFLGIPLPFGILTLLKCTGQVFYRMSFNLGLTLACSWFVLGYEFGGRIPQGDVPFSLHNIWVYDVSVIYHWWYWPWSLGGMGCIVPFKIHVEILTPVSQNRALFGDRGVVEIS